ncbi:MAG: sugar ABC transporter permease [Nocardiopsis sp. BM-2018]|uniref:N,N'-diacetylchitobiose transport system permease protein n=1 Tax=Nocardiopsis metallicus TaxID=179819 RepID=A0A840W150_9ACTN|nr:sugar ABC transporter permease [Nocardiopsis metallicus]MBB5489003.1 N,N'-diacetylchitobiose transport system permease protein [Nocardiopsis metallicus]QRN79265.1 MAG: sugar ABC transporter permease [Nocardiopsis sp. BM-2018]
MTQTLERPTEPEVQRPGRRSGLSRRTRLRFVPYFLILPALTVLAVVLLWPIGQMLYISLHDYGLQQLRGQEAEWNNFGHYIYVLTDERFWSVFRNTIIVCLSMVILTMILGTLVGILMHKLPKWASTTLGLGLMLAWATPVISAAIVYRWLFDTRYGLVNTILDSLPTWLVGSGWNEFNWFNSPETLFPILIITVVWQSFPFVAISVLAGLKSIPNELYEAARIDGASAWRSFWNVTFPMLRPLFALLLILQVIWDFRIFTQLFILAGGITNRDIHLIPTYIFQLGFASTPPNYGMGSAIAVIMTVLVLVISAYYLRAMIRQEETR